MLYEAITHTSYLHLVDVSLICRQRHRIDVGCLILDGMRAGMVPFHSIMLLKAA